MRGWMFAGLGVLLTVGPLTAEQEDARLRTMVDALRSDSVPMNAWGFGFHGLSNEEKKTLHRMLADALKDDDRQLRMYAALYLSGQYGPVSFENEEDWPPELTAVLVDALRDDDFLFRRHGKGNAGRALYSLLQLKTNRPVELLRKELRGDDPQSQYCAAVILSRYLAGSVQPEVSRVLARHLKDDDRPGNAWASYAGLVFLGRANSERLMRDVEAEDWQQAAFFLIGARRFGMEYKVRREYWEKWYQVALPIDRYPHPEAKACLAALYLCSNTPEWIGDRTVPSALDRLYKKSEGIRAPVERDEWLRRRYDFLEPADMDEFHRARHAWGPLMFPHSEW